MPKSGALTRLRSLGLPKDDLEYLIDQWSQRDIDRDLLRCCLIHGMTIEKASEVIDRAPRHCADIVTKYCEKILQHTS